MKAIGTFTLDGYEYTVYRVVQNGREYIHVYHRKSPMDQGFFNIFNQEYIKMDNKELVERIHKEEIELKAKIAEMFA